MSFFYNRRGCFLLLALFFLLPSCQETDIDIYNGEVLQEKLSQIIKSREQVYDIVSIDNRLKIILKKDSITIDTRIIPYLSLDNEGYWTINRERIIFNHTVDSDGSIDFPSLGINPNGTIVVNDSNTDVIIKRPSNGQIYAVGCSGSFICLYRSDDSKTIVPIINTVEHIVPDYIFKQLVDKEILSEKLEKRLSKEECLRYVFFTDVHWGKNQKHSPAIIKHIIDYSKIPYVLFGGDVITSRTETTQEALEIGFQFYNAFSFLGSKLYCLFGNHDDNSTGQASSKERHLTEEQVYSFLQSQSEDLVHYWDYYNYYFDDISSKTRFICLDTGRLYEWTLRSSTFKTGKFLIECLASVPEGWHIVAASHIWHKLTDIDAGVAIEAPFIRPIIEILENYNLRTRSVFSFRGNNIEYDFSSCNATVEYCIGGHIHADRVIMSEKGIPLISVTCDGQQEVVGGVPYKTGTINEQCVTIVVNDYIDREVHIYHIGRGDDVSVKMWGKS